MQPLIFFALLLVIQKLVILGKLACVLCMGLVTVFDAILTSRKTL